MASKSKKSAAIVIFCAVAAVGFFIAIIVVFAVFSGDDDPFADRERDPYMTFERMYVTVDWKSDRSCTIKQDLSVRFHKDEYGRFEDTHGIYIDIPVNSGEKVRDLSVKLSPDRGYSLSHEHFNDIVRIRVGNEDEFFYPGNTLNCEVSYRYITPEHKYGPDILAFNAIGQGWTCPVTDAKVTMTYPKAPDMTASDYEYGIWVAGEPASGVWSNGGKTLTVQAELKEFEGVEIAYKMPKGTLTDYSNTDFVITLVIGLVLVIAVVVLELFVAKNKPLTPIVDYYPPRVEFGGGATEGFRLKTRRMLPVQIGKIIDDNCSARDVTSLIFYWAYNGFLTIDDRENGTYLIKEHDIDSITDYEKRLFNELFSRGTQNDDGKIEVSIESLSGKFADHIKACKNSVDTEYRGEFYKGGFTFISRAMSVLCGLYAVGIAVLTSLRVGVMFNFFGAIAIIPVLLSAVIGTIIAKQFFKLGAKKRYALLTGYVILVAALSFAVSLIVPIDVMSWAERVIFAVCIAVASSISPFLLVRKPEYDEKLNSILGFRDFLRDAEKDRLETLLESDPQYYYGILPYANVLGVSDIWKDKFEGITIEPPTYYHSYRGDVFDLIILHNLTRSVGTNLSYVPPKKGVSFGSFSGGGGHHGGFSGGSFGGGGGGRW